MAVKRGWNVMLEGLKIKGYEDSETFEILLNFVANLEEQIRFVHRAMHVTTKSDPAGRAFDKVVKEMTEEIKVAKETTYQKQQAVKYAARKRKEAIDRTKQKYGIPHNQWILTDEESKDVVTSDHENKVIIDKYPELEETIRYYKGAEAYWSEWKTIGWEKTKVKLDKIFDKLMKLLYDEARTLKQYVDHGQQPEDEEVYTQFDLHGMKVVVDDRTVRPIQVKQYIKYLDEVYNLLKNKRLEKVWYGGVFIRCEECGGVNSNDGGGVGGNYHIGPNFVNIFERPSRFVVELMAHELGHRYWYKHMNSGQRARFEDLIKMGHKPKPHSSGNVVQAKPIPEITVNEAKEIVNRSAKHLFATLEAFEKDNGWFRDVIQKHDEPISKAGWNFKNDMLDARSHTDAGPSINPEVQSLWDTSAHSSEKVQEVTADVRELLGLVEREPESKEAPKSVNAFWAKVFDRERKKWIESVKHEIDNAVADTLIYIDYATQEYNKEVLAKQTEAEKEYEESYKNDPRPVEPVSDYGKSNVSEAFAEAFSHFVREANMNRDQLESFRSVLSSSKHNNIVENVLKRWCTLRG